MAGPTRFNLSPDTTEKVEVVKGQTANLDAAKSSFVVQHTDSSDLANGGNMVQAWFRFVVRGVGRVIGKTSQAFWLGVYSDVLHVGTGSAHSFTANVELQNNPGYAEGGGFQGVLTNNGRNGGYLSLVEGILNDGNLDTRMYAAALRIIKNKRGIEPSSHILVSGEGSQPCDSILSCNPDPNATNYWDTGVDLTRARFNDFAIKFGNNHWLGWVGSDGRLRHVFGVNHLNDTIISCLGSQRVRITEGTFQDRVMVDSDPVNGVVIHVNGSLRRIHVGPPDSGGPGKRYLVVDN